MGTQAAAQKRRTREDGARSRQAILDAAVQLATVEGLDGLSIGHLADHVGMSKSGLFAHFGSKQELQLATIETAEQLFSREVIGPALTCQPGLERLRALAERFLSHVEREVFAGGCFFASTAAELDTRPGPIKERIVAVHRTWTGLIESAVRAAQERDELASDVDAELLAFELNAMLVAANGVWVLHRQSHVFELARRAIADRLERAQA